MSENRKIKKALAGDRSGTKPLLLSELISAVKADLITSAQKRDQDFEAIFQIDEVAIETEVTAERQLGAGGKADFVVATIGVDGGQKNETRHKVSIKLSLLEDKLETYIQGPG